MIWVTRARANVDRIACPWLIKRFIDKEAQLVYVPAEQVLETAKKLGAKSYDAKGADFTHQTIAEGEICSFTSLMRAHNLWGQDPALDYLAKIVNTADVKSETTAYNVPEGAGLQAIAHGFALLTKDDHQKLSWEFPLYDALYEWCKSKTQGDG